MDNVVEYEQLLNQLFTASFRLDKDLRITHISPLLGRYIPELRPGQQLQDAFELVRPRNLSGSNLKLKLQLIFLMISKESRYPIRGQIVELGDKGYMLCGSPWLSRMNDDQIHQYELKDFPLHDAQLDWLFMLSAKKQQVNDLERLSHDLEIANAEAEAAVESKSDFFAVMSHEMRTPLNAIIGSINLMPRKAMSTEQTELLDISVSAAHQLLSVINDVLDYSKMEAGKLEIENSEFQLSNIVTDVIAIVNPIASAKGLQLIEEKGEVLSQYVSGDSGKIKQVLLNLLTNAVKFTETGSVELRVVERSHTESLVNIEFRVIDTGVGVSEEDKEKLFQQFWTSSISNGFQGRGTGLGLDIAKRMTDFMEGNISCESQLGVGSTFIVELPFKPISKNEVNVQPIKSIGDSVVKLLEGKRVLVAEDNQANQIIARLSLQKLGMVVDIANNGFEVLEAIARAPYDAILMDIGMPEMNGIEVTQKIRQDLLLTELPIIACTAHSRSMTSGVREKAGFNGYVGKPIDRNELVKVLLDCIVKDGVIEIDPSSQEQRLAPVVDELICQKDLDKLRNDIGEDNLKAAIQALIYELDKRQHTLKEALNNKSLVGIAEQAHALKSSAVSFGAAHLAQTVKKLEALALDSDPAAFALTETVIAIAARTRAAYISL